MVVVFNLSLLITFFFSMLLHLQCTSLHFYVPVFVLRWWVQICLGLLGLHTDDLVEEIRCLLFYYEEIL